GNQIVGQHAPGALAVTDTAQAGEAVDGHGELDTIIKDFADERLREFDPAGAAVVASRSIRNIRPAFEEDAPARVWRHIGMPTGRERRTGFENDIKATLQSDEIVPEQAVLLRNLGESLGALTRAAHQFFLRGGRVAYAAVHFNTNKFKLRAGC